MNLVKAWALRRGKRAMQKGIVPVLKPEEICRLRWRKGWVVFACKVLFFLILRVFVVPVYLSLGSGLDRKLENAHGIVAVGVHFLIMPSMNLTHEGNAIFLRRANSGE